MTLSPDVRIGLYVIGALAAGGVVGRLLGVRFWLGRLVLASMAAWAINCATLGSTVLYSLIKGEPAPWHGWAATFNAILQGMVPLVMLLYIAAKQQVKKRRPNQ